MGFFSSSKGIRDKAVEFIASNLRMQLGPYIRWGNLVEVIQKDAYIAGYIHGKILGFIIYFIKAEGMAESDATVVSGMVLLHVFGESQARSVSDALKAFQARKFPEFLEGQGKGSLAVAYAVGAQDIRQDPDHAKALASARETEKQYGSGPPSNDHWSAVVGLESLWFAEKLKKYGW